MEADFLRALIASTEDVLEGVLKTEVRAGKFYFKSTPLPVSALGAALEMAGRGSAKVFLDMEEETARRLASAWTQQELTFADERLRTSLDALAHKIGEGRIEVVPVTTKRYAGGATAHAGTTLVVPFQTRRAGWISLDVEIDGGGRRTG